MEVINTPTVGAAQQVDAVEQPQEIEDPPGGHLRNDVGATVDAAQQVDAVAQCEECAERAVLRGPPGGILALKILGETHQVMRRLTALLCGCSSSEVVKCGVEHRSGHVGMVARCSVTVSGPLAAGPADTADLAGAARARCSETSFFIERHSAKARICAYLLREVKRAQDTQRVKVVRSACARICHAASQHLLA